MAERVLHAYTERLSEVDASPDYKIVVIEGKYRQGFTADNCKMISYESWQMCKPLTFLHADEQDHRIIATAACLIERKFIHTCSKVR